MRTLVLFFISSILVTGIMLSGISMKNSTIAVPIAFGILFLFGLYLKSTTKKRAQRKQREHLFQQWVYNQKSRRTY